jgi:peptide/nickel transport system permease protein
MIGTGCSDVRIMLTHILPNIVAPAIVLGSVLFGNAIIIEASLSFLGLGTLPRRPPPGEGCSAVRVGNAWNGCRRWLSSLGWRSGLRC